MESKDKALIVAGACLIAFICVGVFLGYNFMNIDKEGVACMSNPLDWAEDRKLEDTGNLHICECNPTHSDDGSIPFSFSK